MWVWPTDVTMEGTCK